MILKEESSFLVWLHNNTQFELSAELLDEAEGYAKEEKDNYYNDMIGALPDYDDC